MRLYRKEGGTVHILSFPQEIVEKGDYLLIEDQKQKKALIAQVIDVQFANIPGILEELLRDPNTGGNDESSPLSLNGQDFDPGGPGRYEVFSGFSRRRFRSSGNLRQ